MDHMPAVPLKTKTVRGNGVAGWQCSTWDEEGVFLAVLLRSSHDWMLEFHILAYSLSLMCSSILVSCRAAEVDMIPALL